MYHKDPIPYTGLSSFSFFQISSILGFPDSSVGKESTCNAGRPQFDSWVGKICWRRDRLQYSWASHVAQLVKDPHECGRPGFDPWVGKIPWRRERLPTPVFWPGEFHELYSSWGPKELDMTERLLLSFK